MSDLTCPYCGEEDDYNDDPMGEGDQIEIECSSCKKDYLITASYSVYYECEALEDAAKDEDKMRAAIPSFFKNP